MGAMGGSQRFFFLEDNFWKNKSEIFRRITRELIDRVYIFKGRFAWVVQTSNYKIKRDSKILIKVPSSHLYY
jgi:hypothetical protein